MRNSREISDTYRVNLKSSEMMKVWAVGSYTKWGRSLMSDRPTYLLVALDRLLASLNQYDFTATQTATQKWSAAWLAP